MRAGIPKPKVYVIPTVTPNAFATGATRRTRRLTVTEGIAGMLNEDESAVAVVAHELGHVRNRDILISTIVATIANSISYLGTMIRWGAMFGGLGRSDDEEDGGAGVALLVTALIALPFIALLIQLGSRERARFAADAAGAEISAAAGAGKRADEAGAWAQMLMPMSSSTAHLFIVNPAFGPVADEAVQHRTRRPRIASRLQATWLASMARAWRS